MNTTDRVQSESARRDNIGPMAYLVDLALYISVMFLIREVYFSSFGFMTNGLFWSLTTLVVATWRMRARGVTWTELGLRKPDNIKKVVVATVAILAMAITSIVIFSIAQGWTLIGCVAGHFQ